ncbi:OLC1v1034378C1 [Oldenlandia corymbosa var. corymbosa]|uniref:Beta-galactosidase n=1 Tax=Oldenlandia corymbosa var. corymbosa TaxID=529605 RepID=A0AAV1CR95_OLDCO|nr:OLC1v1034378C1 [Oldenlandia corymbosa var. corymbosa]
MGVFYRSFVIFTILFLAFCCSLSESTHISYDNRALKIDGKRKIIISGSIHYPRSTAAMWPSLIKKAKEGGLNAIETYVFWNAHEPVRRQYDFSGDLDLVKFIKTIQDAGLYAILRIGPYVCAEWNYGGFPVWLHNLSKDMAFRTTNKIFMEEMEIFTTKIVDMMKKEKLFASDGGPIILAQIENEFGDLEGAWHGLGVDYKPYVTAVAKFADGLNTGIPWIMCQEHDAPFPMIETCNGMYCDGFTPQNTSMPKIWTELWTGWFKVWGDLDPHRPVEDVGYAVARFYQRGGNLLNYYMYHGGTNFGRSSGGPQITTSYDYDAPLNEYGLPNQPKWGHLKQLHEVILSFEKIITHGNFVTRDFDNAGWKREMTEVTYQGEKLCFFANGEYETYTFHYEGLEFPVLPWSVSIAQDCATEVFNTARVNVTKEVMEYNKQQGPLEWTWRAERVEQLKDQSAKEKSVTFADELLEQKSVTNDTSDYLWYMTSLEVDECSSTLEEGNVTLKVHTDGQVLHAFLNKKRIGTHYQKGGGFVLEAAGKLKPGINTISLLSATVGLPNYGVLFDKSSYGVVGEATLTSLAGGHIDLAGAQWGYKVGISGIDERKFYSDKEKRNWKNNPPVNKHLVWYKATFDTPSGVDPVVLDLEGLGKGAAWVNGNNIGRYWPSIRRPDIGCNPCDYRGPYNQNDAKCRTNCGEPAQKFYHVPRSFLNKDTKKNDLVLFEEFGGDPSQVNVRTVTPKKA